MHGICSPSLYQLKFIVFVSQYSIICIAKVKNSQSITTFTSKWQSNLLVAPFQFNLKRNCLIIFSRHNCYIEMSQTTVLFTSECKIKASDLNVLKNELMEDADSIYRPPLEISDDDEKLNLILTGYLVT